MTSIFEKYDGAFIKFSFFNPRCCVATNYSAFVTESAQIKDH